MTVTEDETTLVRTEWQEFMASPHGCKGAVKCAALYEIYRRNGGYIDFLVPRSVSWEKAEKEEEREEVQQYSLPF